MSAILPGKNYTVSSEGGATFFGISGEKRDNGLWRLSFLKGCFIDVEPSSIIKEVERCIELDVLAGKKDQLAQLVLNPKHAITLYLEGYLPYLAFFGATEDEYSITVPNVVIGETTLTVRIVTEPGEYAFYTTDKDGNVLVAF